jgi:hypothetical protein
MKFPKNIHFPLIAIFIALLLGACNSDRNPESLEDETPNDMTFKERNDRPQMAPQQDNAKVIRNWDAYTYTIEIEDTAFPIVTAEEKEGEPKAMKVKQEDKVEKNKKAELETEVPEKLEKDNLDNFNIAMYMDELEIGIDTMAVVRDLNLNRPPLFDRSCLNANYPVKCSNEKIRAYLKENLSYPKTAIADNYEGVEVVSIRINKEGELEPGVTLLTESTPCQGCAKAAVMTVSQMPDNWVPALKNGEVVATRINIPIRFKHRGTTSLK